MNNCDLCPLALILDDSPTLSLQLQGQLAELGVSAQAVANEAQALQHVAEASVIFIELQLLRGNGFQAARHLRAMCSCPLILITGTGRSTDLQWGLCAGASVVLTRPIQPALLQQTLYTLGLLPAAI